MLFNILNSVINPIGNTYPVESSTLCENFLNFFVDKITVIRQSIVLSKDDPLDTPICSMFLNTFETISMPYLMNMVAQLKPTTSSLDIVPTHFFKQIFVLRCAA